MYAPLIARSLGPWYDGHVSASAVDTAYWNDMYPYVNRHERPSLHVRARGSERRTATPSRGTLRGECLCCLCVRRRCREFARDGEGLP